VVKDSWLYRLEEVIIEGLEVDILGKIKKARNRDKDIVKVVKEMKKAKVKKL